MGFSVEMLDIIMDCYYVWLNQAADATDGLSGSIEILFYTVI